MKRQQNEEDNTANTRALECISVATDEFDKYIDDVMRIMRSAFDPQYGEAWNESQTRAMLSIANTRLWLIGAKHSKSYNGFAIARTIIDETELMLIAVEREKQGLSIGKSLLNEILKYCQSNAVSKVFLEVRDNNSALSFYQSNGFAPIGRRKGYYLGANGDRYDAVTLSLLFVEKS